MRKICFVIMGFGKKMDYESGKEVNLDEIYLKVIKKVFNEYFQEFELVRADEIMTSSIIDVEMYKLLLNASLVIADITTLNPNAIYELGVRHALKQYTTVIIKSKSDKSLPFDINHNRVFTYEKQGYEFTNDEVVRNVAILKKVIEATEQPVVDSPLYTYLNIQPPALVESDLKTILSDAKRKEKNIAKLVSDAQSFMHKSNFDNASMIWDELAQILPDNDYVIQQYALSTYKSKKPNEREALLKALNILSVLNPVDSLDTETIGIFAAIHKRLFHLDMDFGMLETAISFYQKGYMIKKDYYNGENYANCVLMQIRKDGVSKEDIIYFSYEHLKIRKELIEIIKLLEIPQEDFWVFSTLSLSYYALNDLSNYEKYRDLFIKNSDAKWQVETYEITMENLKSDLKFLEELTK